MNKVTSATRRGFSRIAASILVSTCLLPDSIAETEVTLELLGKDSNDFQYTKLMDVSEDGSVLIGRRNIDSEHLIGFRWEDDVRIEIPELREAISISDDGSVIAGDHPAIQGYGAVIWKDGAITTLYDPANVQQKQSRVFAISGNGKVVAGEGGFGEPSRFYWKDGVMNSFGSETFAKEFRPLAISYDGSVIAGDTEFVPGGNKTAYRWEDGAWTNLGYLPGHTRSTAWCISAVGSVIGGSSLDDSQEMRGCIWEDGSIRPLELLPSGIRSQVIALSGDGKTAIGFIEFTSEPWMRLVLWTEKGNWAPVLLRDILEEHNIDLNGIDFRWSGEPRIGGGPFLNTDGSSIIGEADYYGKEVVYRIRILDLDPLIGGAAVTDLPGWFLSDWFGYYSTAFAPWIFHAQHGFVFRWPESTNESTYFYDNAMVAWWWTNETDYPSLYVFDPPADNGGTVIESAWLWYFEGSKSPRSFGVMTGGDGFLFFGP